MLVAVTPNTAAVLNMVPSRQAGPFVNAPVWIRLPPSAFDDAASWPMPVRTVANLLRSARAVTLSAEENAESKELQLHMQAEFATEQAAETVRNQLEIETRMLKLELMREHEKPSDSDITGMLASGSFQLVNNSVDGSWPLHREFLRALQIQ
jgi:hypothetical protein